jgi:hypothetical protein
MGVADVPKSVIESRLLTWRADAPFDNPLVRVQARRQAQQLDQMLGRFVVLIMGVVLDDEAHNKIDFLILNGVVAYVFIAYYAIIFVVNISLNSIKPPKNLV